MSAMRDADELAAREAHGFGNDLGPGVRQMQARFASRCGACSGPIGKGADIRYVKGLPANHEACGDPGGVPSAARPTSRKRGNSISRAGGYSTFHARCSHEDYPCCGCDA